MQVFSQRPLNNTWLKAAVVGSLWASVEIILGSFMHNLRVPFSGTILTAFSVYLLIAFLQLWNEKGIVWRAGLITALMKSLSPSAVIIGPMVGILTEALIIWLFILVFGRNLFSYVLGGAVAVASALLHKVASLLILYGFDLVRVLEGLYHFAARQLRAENADPVVLIWIILGIYLLIGSVAAVLGYLAGKKARVVSGRATTSFDGAMETHNELFRLSIPRPYSLALLLTHLGIMIACLWLLNMGALHISVPLCILYALACFTWYKGALRHLKKYGFWIQFLIITLMASFLLEGYSSGNYFSMEGLIIGLKMNLRAIVVMVGFSALSVELKNPLIRSLLYDRGLASLYQSLSLAFAALPSLIARIPSIKMIFKGKKSFISFLFSTSRELSEHMTKTHMKKPAVVIITGDVGGGKTTFTASLIEKLKKMKLRIAGFTAPGIFSGGQKQGFWLEDVATGKRCHLSSKENQENWIKHGHYYFDPQALEEGRKILSRAVAENAQLVVIDEVGPMELGNKGWSESIEMLCRHSHIRQLWVVRRTMVRKALVKWNVGDVYVFDMGKDDPEELMKTIAGLF